MSFHLLVGNDDLLDYCAVSVQVEQAVFGEEGQLGLERGIVGKFTRRIDARAETKAAQALVAALDIRTTGLEQEVNHLSGGNQQKVSLGKWLAAECDILIVDEPTVGVDIQAKAQIHHLLWDLAAKEGKAIILISSDMPELIGLAGRILVFKDKQIVHEIAEIHERGLSYDEISRRIGLHLN